MARTGNLRDDAAKKLQEGYTCGSALPYCTAKLNYKRRLQRLSYRNAIVILHC
jgi:hypothetical protein